MTPAERNTEIVRSARILAEALDAYTLHDIGPALTCFEAEALARLLGAVGNTDNATELIASHTQDDEPEELENHG